MAGGIKLLSRKTNKPNSDRVNYDEYIYVEEEGDELLGKIECSIRNREVSK